MVELPIELVECIVDNLYPDRATLLNCALVGRAWLASSQRGLFRLISLKPPNSTTGNFAAYLEANGRLIALLDEKPRLASHVRALQLTWSSQMKPNISHKWEALCASTAEVIQRLPSVESISFQEVDWHSVSFSPILEETLIDILRAPSVTQVFLHTFFTDKFATLTSLLSHTTHLKVLKLEQIKYTGKELIVNDITSNASPRSIELDQLQLRIDQNPGLSFPVDWFQQEDCPFELGHLRSLKIYHHRLDHRRAALLLQQAGNSLGELELQAVMYPPAIEQSSEFVHLGYTPNLHTLKLFQAIQIDAQSPVPWIQSIFQPLFDSDRSAYPLQHLTVELFTLQQRSSPDLSQWDEWAAFDALFEKPHFSSLQTVNIVIEGRGTLPRNVPKLLCEKLPFLSQSGKLKVTFSLYQTGQK